MGAETVTVRIETDTDSDEIEVPTALVDILGEGDESAPDVIGDLGMLGLAQQAHGIVHHNPEAGGERLEEVEAVTMDLFEERFGESFAEMTGHDH